MTSLRNVESNVLSRLPAELFAAVLLYLANRDIKNLRLTCKNMNERAQLRIKRVFLSANPRNIEVFRAIADHDKFRRGIVEIIWDDVQLVDDVPYNFTGMWMQELLRPPPDGVPPWFARLCSWNIGASCNVRGFLVEDQHRDPDLPIDASWSYYQKLLEQQHDVIASEADVEALRYGLERFPALRRITITPAAHGLLDAPLYETPMIRAFPRGFNYPILNTWPAPPDFDYSGLHVWPLPGYEDAPYEVPPWDQEGEKMKWRGFCIITRELAQRHNHHVSELVIDVHSLQTGLSCRIFDQPCKEYSNLVTLLQKPGFSRIDLALIGDGQYYDVQAWSSFRSGYLRRALNEASDLTHFSLQTRIDYDQVYDPRLSLSDQLTEHFISLPTILPIGTWQKLRHFSLSGFLVRLDDLVLVLAALPITLRSVELSFLQFTGERGNWYNLLVDMRDMLDWHKRLIGERPVLTVHIQAMIGGPRQYTCLDDAVNKFLYCQGTNPFDEGGLGLDPFPGRGIERNPFPFGCRDTVRETLD